MGTPEGDQQFSIAFLPRTRPSKNFYDEVDAAARDVASEASRLNKPIWVCFSGGIDSEVVCESLYRQGIHFRALTLQHTAGTNAYDIAYAKRWCKAHQVEQKIVPIDMEKFIRSDIDTYVKEGYVANYPFRYLQVYLLETVENMGGLAILGGGEQMYETVMVSGTPTAVLHFQAGYAAPLEWCRRTKVLHEPYFFFRTPELIDAYMKHPIVSRALEYPETFQHKANSYLLKRLVYQSSWPTMETRHKYDGFEKVRNIARERRIQLEAHFGKQCSIYTLPIEVMTKQLKGEGA